MNYPNAMPYRTEEEPEPWGPNHPTQQIPTSFLYIDGRRIAVNHRVSIPILTSSPFCDHFEIGGEVISGPYGIGKEEYIDVRPITDKSLISKITGELLNVSKKSKGYFFGKRIPPVIPMQ